MNPKHIRKWFKQAKAIADDGVPCLSRAIGSVVVNPETNTIVSTGYNGTGRGLPDCDSYEHLKEYVYPQLTDQEKSYIEGSYEGPIYSCTDLPERFASTFSGCKQCPRKLVNARSGERLELCQCSHSEENAVNNAALAGHSTYGCYIFCWCGVPCVECSSAIIQAGIKEVHCIEEESGSANHTYATWRSEWRFKNAGIKVNKYSKEWILNA